jgi:hypothetical protein
MKKKELKDQKRKYYCELFTEYIFLIWDGLGFFGFDDNKLARLKGKKPKWYDRFSNKRWVALNVSVAVFILYILVL